MKQIGIVFRDKPASAALANDLAKALDRAGARVWSQRSESAEFPDLAEADMVLVLGGDGTLLSMARHCAQTATPIIGVNFGHVGFLTEIEPDDALTELPYYLSGEYWVDERAMLTGVLEVDGQREEFLALNDFVVARGAEPRVIRFKMVIDGSYYTTMTADGVIVATATGSTAYNLAAGGPILHPSVRGSVLTPIAPHLAADRPLVLEPNATVQLELIDTSGDAVFSADGQTNRPFDGAAIVTITNSPLTARFLRRRPRSHFYQVLSAKLSER